MSNEHERTGKRTQRISERCARIMSNLGAKRRYLLTIVRHDKLLDVCSEDLDTIRIYLQDHGVIIHEGFDEKHGLYDQLHFHGICTFSGQYKNLSKFNGFRIFWKIIKKNRDLPRIRKYIYKNKKIQ